MGLQSRTFWHHPAFGGRRWRLYVEQPNAAEWQPSRPLADLPHHEGWSVGEDESGTWWTDRRDATTKWRRCKVMPGGRCHYFGLSTHLVERTSRYLSGSVSHRVHRRPTSKAVVICVHEFTVCFVPKGFLAWRELNKDTRWVRADGKDKPTLAARLRGLVGRRPN